MSQYTLSHSERVWQRGDTRRYEWPTGSRGTPLPAIFVSIHSKEDGAGVPPRFWYAEFRPRTNGRTFFPLHCARLEKNWCDRRGGKCTVVLGRLTAETASSRQGGNDFASILFCSSNS